MAQWDLSGKKACLGLRLRLGGCTGPSFSERQGVLWSSSSVFQVTGRLRTRKRRWLAPRTSVPPLPQWVSDRAGTRAPLLTSSPVLSSLEFLNNLWCTWRCFPFRIQALLRFLCMAGSQEPWTSLCYHFALCRMGYYSIHLGNGSWGSVNKYLWIALSYLGPRDSRSGRPQWRRWWYWSPSWGLAFTLQN